jgi:hypothetical protein
MGSLVSLAAVVKDRSQSARLSLLAYCETANSLALPVITVVTSKNGKWNKLVAFTGANSWRRNHWES